MSNEQLYDICTRPCSSGPLQFLIKRRPQPHLRALPPPPVIAPPVPLDRQPLPPIGTSPFSNHFPGKRPSPQSQHETSSSTSDRRGDFSPSYEGPALDSASSRRNNPLPRPPQQRPVVGIRILRNPPPSISLASSRTNSASSSGLPFVPPLQIRSPAVTPPLYARSPPATRDGSYSREHLRSRDGLSSRDGSSNRDNTLNLLDSRPGHIRRGSDVEQNEQDRLLRKDREKRERDRREKELREQMRSEQTKQWQMAQMRNQFTDTPSPIERLSPTATWNHSDFIDARTRPGTSGTPINSPRTASSDRPSTAQPLIRSFNNTSFYPSSNQASYRPNTANLISSSRQGSIPNHVQPHSYQPPATATGVTTPGFQTSAGGQAVPDWWVVNWHGRDARAPLPMKSFSDLRQQAANTQPRRRLPTPTSATSSRSINNFGGPSDYIPPHSPPHHAQSIPLPYHDVPKNILPLSPPFRRGEFASSSSEQIRSGSGGWIGERPRSPPGTPSLYSSDRPDYVPPPPLPDAARNEFNSFGQAAVQLAAHKLSKDRLDKENSPTVRSPVEPSESTLRQDEYNYPPHFMGSDMGSESTLVSQMGGKPGNSLSSMTLKPPGALVPGPSSPAPDDDGEYSDETEESTDDDSSGANFWQPEKKRGSKRMSKNYLPPITTNATLMPPKIIVPGITGAPLSPIPASPITTTRIKPLQPLSSNPNRNSLFVKRDSITWAVRPPPEDMYERLEEFFPDHDLDKPVIDMTPSGSSSPIQPEAPPVLPTTTKIRYKKSIRAAAHERASKGSAAAAQMLRKRSTKLWGSRVEEVTPAQAKAAALGAVESPPPSGISTKRS